MTTISQAINGTLALVTVGREIYESIAQAMDSAQNAAGTGASKKEWVIAYAKSIIQEAGKNWDKWAKYVSDFIDAAKSIYNAVKGIF